MVKLHQKGIGPLTILLILFIAGTLSFAGWKIWGSNSGGQQKSIQSTNSAENTQTQDTKLKEISTGTIITTSDSQFGTILFDENKQAIYIWELEESTKAECYGDCADAWPPVLTDGAPRATGGVKNELLGTTTRTDGSIQVTYNGHPLYYYAHEKPGEVKCHNIRTHGGLWWVIQPNGIRAS